VIVGRTDPDPQLLKPHPHLVLRVLDTLGGDPAMSSFVGDSTSDVLSAKAAGTHSVGHADKPEGRASPRRRCRRHRDQHRRAARSPGRPPAVILLALPGASCKQPSRGGSLVLPPRPGWRDLAGRFLACPTPSRKRPPTNPAPEPAAAGEPHVWPTSLAPPLAHGGLSACHGVHRPPGPRAEQAARPGISKGPHQGGAVHQTDDCCRPVGPINRVPGHDGSCHGQLTLEAQPALLHHPPRGGVGGHGGADDPSPSRPLLNCRPAAAISLVTCDDQDDAEPGPEASSACDATERDAGEGTGSVPVACVGSKVLDEQVDQLRHGHRRPIITNRPPGPHHWPMAPVDIPEPLIEPPSVDVANPTPGASCSSPSRRAVSSPAWIRAVPMPRRCSGPMTSK
jgi:hypothetical protein